MTRRAPNVDSNQSTIVLHLVGRGWSVQSLAGVAGGCPDLLVGADGVNVLLEVKDGDKPPSARQLTDYQRKWHKGWSGQVATVTNETEAAGVVLAEIARRWPGQEDR